MRELVLIDGNSLLFRAYFAMRPMVNSKGIHTQGVFAFVNMFNKITKDYEPKYIAVAFDMKGGTFRHDEYKEYKAGRQQTPPELLSQIPLMHQVLEAMNVAVLEKEKYEADDIIGTIASDASKKGLNTLVITGDKDELQLVDENVNVLITKKGLSEFDIYDIDKMNERYGLTPAQFIDLKGLMGDNSDNIPGIAGIGEKKGLALLHEYGSLENVLDHADVIKGKMGENIRASKDIARLSKWLATINTESPIEYEWDDLKFTDPDYGRLIDIYTELEFNQFIKQLEEREGGSRHSSKQEEQLKTINDVYSELKSLSLDEFFIEAGKDCNLFIELATDNSHIDIPAISSIALFNSINSSYCIIDSPIEMYSACMQIAEKDYKLSGCGMQKVVYSLKHIYEHDFKCQFDNQICEYLLNPTAQKYSLDRMILSHLGMPCDESDLDIFSDDVNYDSSKLTSENCLRRAYFSSVISAKQLEAIHAYDKLEKLFHNCEIPLITTLAAMEFEGIKCDPNVLKTIGRELVSEIEKLEKDIYAQAGTEFNINSPKQLGHILFEELEIPYPKQKSKTGTYSTAADILDKLKDNHKIVSDVLNYRKLAKLNSTYIEGLLPLIGKDGKVHPHFQQTVTATGRLSCTEPNLQNIPIRDDYGRLIRKAFITSTDDNVFTGSDYSQIELRILASLSGDESLIYDFKQGKDIHRSTAARVFGIDEDDVTSLDRTKAKAVNFGVVYGMSGFGLGESLSISRAEGQRYINDYFDKHVAVKKYLDDRVKEGETQREISTYFGRIRQLPEFASSRFMEREAAKRLAMNTPIQGTAADIIKIAMNSVHDEIIKRGLKSKLILQIHDELIVEGPKSEGEEIKELLNNCMRSAADLAVELVCDIHSADTWYNLK